MSCRRDLQLLNCFESTLICREALLPNPSYIQQGCSLVMRCTRGYFLLRYFISRRPVNKFGLPCAWSCYAESCLKVDLSRSSAAAEYSSRGIRSRPSKDTLVLGPSCGYESLWTSQAGGDSKCWLRSTVACSFYSPSLNCASLKLRSVPLSHAW